MEEYFEEDYAADDAENDDDSNGADYFDDIAEAGGFWSGRTRNGNAAFGSKLPYT